jgi:hypothetical protein
MVDDILAHLAPLAEFFFFFGRLLLRSMLAREREHTTCATVPGPRHRSNTTLCISRMPASNSQHRSPPPPPALPARRPHHDQQGPQLRVARACLLIKKGRHLLPSQRFSAATAMRSACRVSSASVISVRISLHLYLFSLLF